MDLQTFLSEKQESLEAPKYDYHLDVYHTFMGMLPDVDFSGVEPQPDPMDTYYGVRFELGDVLVTVQQDIEEGTLRPSFQGHGSTISRYGGWVPFYKNKLEDGRQDVWKIAYQMAVADAKRAQQSFELLSQAPNHPVLGTHQFASRDSVLTFDAYPVNFSVVASSLAGHSLTMEFTPAESDKFLEAILLHEALVQDGAIVNSFELQGMTAKYVLVLTAFGVTVWHEIVQESQKETDFKLFVNALRLFYRDLKEWATRYAAQLDCTLEDAYQAYEEHITSLPE